MRVVFKTSYDNDINLFKDKIHFLQYFFLFVFALALPFIVNDYYLGEVALVLIWAIAGMGLMVLVGHSGQVSLGHAAFMAVGAYSVVILQSRLGLPFIVALPLAGLFSSFLGILIAIPTAKLHGIYLAILTLAVSILVEDIIVLADPLTGGVNGIFAPDIEILSINFNRYGNIDGLYWLILFITIVFIIGYKNILRSPLGRAFSAIRDSEVSALAMGINIARTRTLAFAISCFITGISGALFGHFVTVFNYETFNVILSINLLLMIVIGGLGSIHGAFFGAMVIGFLPIIISFFRDQFLNNIGINLMNFPGIETGIFSLILILFILFEPFGIYGRWLKIRTYFQLFPLYRKDMFKRQKSYLKTERVR